MKKIKSSKQLSTLHWSLLRVTKIHYLFLALLAGQIVIYDAWQLTTPEAALKRWIAVGALFVLVTIVWYIASGKRYTKVQLHHLVWWLITADILFVSYYVYLQRGMASKAIALYAIPIIVSAIFLSRRALLAAASLSIAAYVLTVLIYFAANFNEGYKIELYGEISFYSGVMLVLAGLLWAVVHAKKKL